DARLNPTRGAKEILRRLLGRRPHARWEGRVGVPAITEAWNGAVFASRFGASGSMVLFGGGHNDYFGSDVHAFDLGTRQWSRISDGYVWGEVDHYGAGAVYPSAVYPDGSPLPPHTYGYVQYDSVGNDYLLLKGETELGPDVKATPIPHMFNLDSLTRISHNGIISRAASAENAFTSIIRGDQHYCHGDRQAIGRRWQRFGFARANA